MSQYLVASGHDIALASLSAVVPQPSSPGILVTQRSFGLDGTPHDMAPYIPWTWNNIGSVSIYTTLLTQLGLSSLSTSSLTVYTRASKFTFARYNVLAVVPENGVDIRWERYFPRNLTIYLTRLEAL